MLSVAYAHLLSAEVQGIGLSNPISMAGIQWRRMRLSRFRDVYVAQAPLIGRLDPKFFLAGVLKFRLSLDIARDAGYSACSLTSPALVSFPGHSLMWWEANRQALDFLDHPPLADAMLNDAAVGMSVNDRVPDRSELDSNARVRGDSIQLTCGEIPNPKPNPYDEFFLERVLAEKPSCASVQTFRTSDAAEDLNRRIFLGGLLLSAAVAMLLEALFTGRTETALVRT